MAIDSLPTELWEAILDAIPSSDGFLTPDEHSTLLACRDTCNEWRPHAQFILNQWMRLGSPRAVSAFVSGIRSAPRGGADFVEHLVLDWLGLQGSPGLSQTVDLFMTPMPNLSWLDLHHIRADLSTRVVRMRLPFFAGITFLHCHHCQFSTPRDMLDLIWACPNLDSLVLVECRVLKDSLTPEIVARLSTARRHLHGCGKLRALHINVQAPWMLQSPRDVFGSSIRLLELNVIDFARDGESSHH
ncbi:hypothetical protein C8Q79DRAFT_992815 [Trametes meyenii]|nr:hypothetical protein C8Q79DRAFT_992815 [Trametes meyenii]